MIVRLCAVEVGVGIRVRVPLRVGLDCGMVDALGLGSRFFVFLFHQPLGLVCGGIRWRLTVLKIFSVVCAGEVDSDPAVEFAVS